MNVTKIDERRVDTRQLTNKRKRFGLAFAALPFAVFAVLAFGEAAGLEPGWWSHLVQLGAVALLAVLAWRHPRIGGPLLIAVGGVFTVLITLFVNGTFAENLITGGIFFAPLIVAGAFFSLAGYEARERRTPDPSRKP